MTILDYVSLIGGISSVIAAAYAALAYYRMTAEDAPTLHIRFLEAIKEDEYNVLLEIHPGKRPAKYKRLSIEGGYIDAVETENIYAGNFLRTTSNKTFRRSCPVNIFVPAAVARDAGPDLSFIVKMKSSAVVSLLRCRIGICKKLSIKIDKEMSFY